MLCRILAAFALFIVVFSQPLYAADKVVLQLKWEHEFQFAGYYAALWQGYYAEEGLDVEIRPASTPDGRLLSPVEEVVEGRADFAIGALDILVHRDRGVPLVVLAPIFQRSPNSIFSLQHTPLSSLEELSGLSIASPAEDFTRAEVMALFNAHGVNAERTRFVDKPPALDTLIHGHAQAIATYSISARFAAQELGITLNEMSPQAFGLDFYGDTLYTHEREFQKSPERVEKFLRASLKGWEYALNHKAEIAKRIADELPRHLFSYRDFEAYNMAFADVIDTYMAYPYTEIGHNNYLRWKRMVSQLKAVGVLTQELDVNQFIYSRTDQSAAPHGLQVLLILAAALTLVFGLSFVRERSHIWLFFTPCLLLVVTAVYYIETEIQADYQAEAEVDVLQQLNSVSTNLVSTVNRNLAHISGMAAHISAYPSIDQSAFSRYAASIFAQEPILRNIGAAPDMVVRMIYPLEENRAALGLDYRVNERQRDVVMRVRETGKLAVAGPLNLVQGGVAFIARIGVTSQDKDGNSYFWGILSAPFMADELYRAAGLLDPGLSVDIAIRGRDGLGASGDVFYGDGSLFGDPNALKTTIRVGDGTWQLVAAPKEGWVYHGSGILMVRMGGAALAVSLMLFLVWRQRQMEARTLVEHRLKANEGLLREMSRVALIHGWRIAYDKRTLRWSSSALKLLGITDSHALDTTEALLAQFESQQSEKLRSAIDEALNTGKPFDIELYRNIPGGERRWIRCIGNATREGDGWEVTGALQDITERRKFTEVVERQANYDLLTELPNRSAFYETLRWALADAKRNKQSLALLFIDLDNFKPVNDSFGHAAGDELLKQVSSRLRNNLREGDVVARISGDEFTVILREFSNEFAPIDVAEKLLNEIRIPYSLDEKQVMCGASIGIAVYPNDGNQVDELISKADYAMYEVKKNGRNGCKYFTRSMQERSEARHSLYTRLQKAIINNQLSVEYQPVIDMRSGRMRKCEALVRWYDEDGNAISPAQFIPLAEETSLINDIDYFVLGRATDYVEQLSAKLGHNVGLSVNLSPRLFVSTEAALNHWLDRAVAAASRIELTVEITERMLIEGSERASMVLDRLKRSGATIAIDDFGTGYSSLSYLTRLPIDYLKIDQSFVQQMQANSSSRMVVDTIISLAKNLGLELIAEGVETDDQLDILKHKGCDYVQGFLLARPMSEQRLENWLEEE